MRDEGSAASDASAGENDEEEASDIDASVWENGEGGGNKGWSQW
jgi:hypothetical protein